MSFVHTTQEQGSNFTRKIIMEGLPLSVQELSRELSAFGVDRIAIQALKGRQLFNMTVSVFC